MSIEEKAFAAAKSGATDAFSAYILGLEKTAQYRDEVRWSLVTNPLLIIANRLSDNDSQINSTPLHYAAANGHLDLVQIFLLNDADVNAVNNFMETPLHSAAGKGQAEIVKRLLQVKNIQLDLQTDEGWTALHLATEKGHPEVVKLLVDHGADVSIQDKDGEAAVEYAHDPIMVEAITFGSHSSDEPLQAESAKASIDKTNKPVIVENAEETDKIKESAATVATNEPQQETVSESIQAEHPATYDATTTSSHNSHHIISVNEINHTSSGSDKVATTDTTLATDSADQLETIDIEEKTVSSPEKVHAGVTTNQCCTIM